MDEHVSEAEVRELVAAVLVDANIHPAQVHAFRTLGYIVTEENAEHFDDDDIDAWDAAVEQWLVDHPGAPGP